MVEDQRPAATKRAFFTATIRYGKMAYVAKFKTDRETLVKVRDKCIVRTDRGREVGTVLTAPEALPEAIPPEGFGDIIRRASPEDLKSIERIDKETRVKEQACAKEEVRKLNMPMKVVEVDHVFGGERVIIYFVSETRVDFRELVRRLAHEFRTRIELKQVGARDEARLVGDVGHCGLELCCRGHLKELGGITMDMAKVQKHTADPSKITGRCGKLLCCLRYEYTAYTEARDLLPPRGLRIETRKGNGVVVDQNMLLREVTIVPEGRDERIVVRLEEIVGAPKSQAGCSGCEKGAPAPETSRIETKVREDTKVDREPHLGEPPPAPADFWPVGKVEEFEEGKGRHVLANGKHVAVFRIAGAVYATDAACPHQGGPLADGTLAGTVVTCPWHQWQFDVASGESKSGPSRLATFETKIDGGQVFVKA